MVHKISIPSCVSLGTKSQDPLSRQGGSELLVFEGFQGLFRG